MLQVFCGQAIACKCKCNCKCKNTLYSVQPYLQQIQNLSAFLFLINFVRSCVHYATPCFDVWLAVVYRTVYIYGLGV